MASAATAFGATMAVWNSCIQGGSCGCCIPWGTIVTGGDCGSCSNTCKSGLCVVVPLLEDRGDNLGNGTNGAGIQINLFASTASFISASTAFMLGRGVLFLSGGDEFDSSLGGPGLNTRDIGLVAVWSLRDLFRQTWSLEPHPQQPFLWNCERMLPGILPPPLSEIHFSAWLTKVATSILSHCCS